MSNTLTLIGRGTDPNLSKITKLLHSYYVSISKILFKYGRLC